MMAQLLVASSAAIALLLGFLHLAYTFFTRKLTPRDERVEREMRQALPRITPQITMWSAWIGFNATHSMGIILFGAIYGYLALFAWRLLVHSAFFVGRGSAFFLSYLVIARVYFHKAPLICIAVAAALYVLGIVLAIR